ncbi:MAG: SpvB/TcaC N-terminal domain-containing protein, partial [Amphritea sp.]|nr:SpvB/TcaC N-terminal domain-containing protein [Amphritea sp.]
MLSDQNQQGEQERSSEGSQGQAIPSIDLPKGGGAIRGIGEKFAANPVTGTGSLSVPIATSPGRSGFGPALSLSYDSGAGNGVFGFGWSLSLPSITRKTDKGLPQYLDAQASDVFLLSGAEDLVPILVEDGSEGWHPASIEPHTVAGKTYSIKRYRPRIEGLFARIERWENAGDPHDVHWRSISRDNILTLYGKDGNSRITDPADTGRIFKWLICETRDDKGNALIYRYKSDNGVGVDFTQVHERNRGALDDPRRQVNRYLKRVLYGNRASLLDATGQRPALLTDAQVSTAEWMFESVFDYGEHHTQTPTKEEVSDWAFRADAFSNYRPGFELRTTRLCQRVLMFHHFEGEEDVGLDCLVRSTDFTYSHEQDPDNVRNPVYTFLRSVTQSSYKREGNGYLKRNLPPVEFEYTQPIVQDTLETVDSVSLENLPMGVDGAAYQWTDLHGEGIPGILTEQGNTWFYKRNESPIGNGSVKLSPLELVATKPNMALSAGAQFRDMAGDGRPDLVMLDGPTPGFYGHDSEEGWQTFRPFTSQLNRNMREQNLKFIDLDGDGHADVFITEDDAFVWHASLAEQGFGPARRVAQTLDEEKGPRLVFADGTQSIYLADLSGDSLTDLVRIRCGEVCYWPNLGYGKFGAKVSMDHAPFFDNPDQFNQNRIRLADIDGSGTTDIIYLHHDGVRLYFNQSGNSWSAPQILNVFPRVDDLVNIVPADLLGNGTACLVWSSPLPGDTHQPMRYINLMGGQKPHLLIKTKNNLGLETRLSYAPSTQFYLADKRAGKPWITKLPFPVHVVAQVTVTDKWRKTEFSTSYSYHHGYFDGVEREFRGFGRVEQVDIENYQTFSKGNAASPYITDDHTLYQPPVKTITWFHTGAFLDRERVLSQFENEYFIPEGFREQALPTPALNAEHLTADEWREALRSCKGMMLRQEVYELNVDALEEGKHQPVKLFSTAYHNCHIQRLQARVQNRHAVFLVTESEAITYNYELDLKPDDLVHDHIPPDPRIAHTLNLKIDDYGNVLQSVAVVYPRIGQHEDDTLEPEDIRRINEVQKETHVAYTETHFTNDINNPLDVENYRLRVPCEARSYELTGISPAESDDHTSADPQDNLYFTLDELNRFQLSLAYQATGEVVQSIAYHQQPNHTIAQKRLLQHSKILYFNDKVRNTPEFLVEPLPFAEQGKRGLPYETYTLALTDDLLEAILADKLTPEIRTDLNDAAKSGYLSGSELAARFNGEDTDADTGVDTSGQYWVRSGIAGFEDDAAAHFFLPERYTDAFDQTTTLKFDPRDLYIQSSTDAIGNTVSVEKFDFRVLAPRETKDINDNLSEVIFDILGLPTASAVKGKGDEADNLTGFTDELLNPDRETRINFFVEPRAATETIADYQQRQQNEAKR